MRLPSTTAQLDCQRVQYVCDYVYRVFLRVLQDLELSIIIITNRKEIQFNGG